MKWEWVEVKDRKKILRYEGENGTVNPWRTIVSKDLNVKGNGDGERTNKMT